MATEKFITIQDKKFRKYISSAKIRKAIDEMAEKINRDFKDKKPVFISVLNGSFLFTADLLKKIKLECEISFIKVASYSGIQSTGKANTLIGLNENIKRRSVIILDDIIDSGNTLEKIMTELKKHNSKQIYIAALFFKPDGNKKKNKIDYIGMEVPNNFLVGYGLDYNGLGRNLPDIYMLKSPDIIK